MDANRSTFAKSSAFVPCSQNYGGQVGATGTNGHESGFDCSAVAPDVFHLRISAFICG